MELLILQTLIFLGATYILVKSADYFIDNAEKLGSSLHWPHFLTGVLIVAIGTSLPELSTSVASMLRGETDMVMGNVFGSNVANIFLGLGLVFFLINRTVPFKHNIFNVHFPILIMAMALAILVSQDRVITRVESLFFFGILGAYLWFLFAESKEKKKMLERYEKFSWKFVIGAVIGLIGLIISARFVVDSVITLAETLGFAKTALAATLVAIGTSLPEMMVVYAALKRNNVELVIGNIIGSNIFNVLLILGACGLISDIAVSDLSYQVIIPFAVAATAVYWVISIDQRITKQEGLAMTFLYILFAGKLFGFF